MTIKSKDLTETRELLGDIADMKANLTNAEYVDGRIANVTNAEYVDGRMESWRSGFNKGLVVGAVVGSAITMVAFLTFG